MDFSLYYLLATLVLTTASPLQQKNPAVTEESLQASPSAAGHPLTPLGNAAIWQEAVAIDANKSVNGTPSYENQNFYILLATLQSDENSSNSHFDHSTSLISQGLEVLHAYPVQFSQAQAAQPVDAFSTSLITSCRCYLS